MTDREKDLDLLFSLRVPETPPESPSHSQGYLSDDGLPTRRVGAADMSVFRDAVKDYLDQADPVGTGSAFSTDVNTDLHNRKGASSEVDMEKYSGLRIRNTLVSQVEINNHFADVRFVRLPAIRNLMVDDGVSGCWATVGVLTEKGQTKVSSNGKNFCVWKLGDLGESNVSVFLFGDAYSKNSCEAVGTVFALFNSSVRKDANGKGFILSIYSKSQILKMGTSSDYGVCKGKRKDGNACTIVINKRKRIYCKYHASRVSDKYSTVRTELKGGNLNTTFNRSPNEGIYMFDPLEDKSGKKHVKSVKVLSVDALKKALSKADKVTTQRQSQGIRFLTEVAGAKLGQKSFDMESTRPHEVKSTKRSFLHVTEVSSIRKTSNFVGVKRNKTHTPSKMIELDVVSSDDEG